MPIDPNSPIPLYNQIVRHVHGVLAAGVYRPGEMLPSIRAMAIELAVNPITVQRAYQELERQGMVAAKRGLGMFVTTRGRQSAQRQALMAVEQYFVQGIEVALQSDMPLDVIRSIFDDAMERKVPGSNAATPT